MRITHVRAALTLASITAAGIIVTGPAALAATAEGAIPPVTSCEALAKADLSRQDAQITSTATATRDGHAYCAQLPNLRFASLMNMDFATRCPLVRRSRLISGSCPSTRTFAPRFLQTPPRGDSPCASLTLHLHQVG